MMNTNGYFASPARGAASKSQLQQDLFETKERLDKKEIILARCMQELQGIKIKLEATDDLNTKLLSKDLETKNARTKIKKLENQLKELRKKNYALQRQNKDLKQQIKFHEQDETSVIVEKLHLVESRVEKLESQTNELKQKMKVHKGQNQKLQQKESLTKQKKDGSESNFIGMLARFEALENKKLSLNQQVDTLSGQIAMFKKNNSPLQKKANEKGQNGRSADIFIKA